MNSELNADYVRGEPMVEGADFLTELHRASAALSQATSVGFHPWRSMSGALLDAVIALEELVEADDEAFRQSPESKVERPPVPSEAGGLPSRSLGEWAYSQRDNWFCKQCGCVVSPTHAEHPRGQS